MFKKTEKENFCAKKYFSRNGQFWKRKKFYTVSIVLLYKISAMPRTATKFVDSADKAIKGSAKILFTK